MSFSHLIILFTCFVWLTSNQSFGVVRESDLVARWTFDEGNGSVANDSTGSGLDVLLSANAGWGMESNNTAISKYSLNLMNGDAYARVLAHDNIKASGIFSYLIWFKSNGQPDSFSQLLAKKEGSYSSFFTQIEPDGRSLKTIVRSYGTYYDNGVIPFSLDEWHQLVFTFDGTNYNSFLDGQWVGAANVTWPIDSNDGELGVGGTADGSSLFKGWIDDLRFYSIALHPREVEESYGNGAGDFGPKPKFTVTRATSTMPVTVTLTFEDSDQNPVTVSDLNESDFAVNGGDISNLRTIGLNYMFELNASQKPKRVKVELPAGLCRDDQNISNSYGSMVVVYSDIVTKSEDLVGWWTFDELNGSTVPDHSGTGSTAYLLGNPMLDSTDPALGSKSILLDGDGDAAKIFGLKKTTPEQAYRFNDLEL